MRIGNSTRHLATHTVMIVLCAAGALLFTNVAAAQQSAEEFFKPVVSQRQFADLVRPLELTREQRMIVEMVYEDYLDAMEQATTEADRMADRAGRRIVRDALTGKRLVPADDLRYYRLEVFKVYRPLVAEAHELAERLLGDLSNVLTQEQRPRLEEQIMRFRRMLHLHPRHEGRGDYEYAGEGVDIILLLEDALGEGGELQQLPHDAIEPLVRKYERELDALLRANAVGHHEVALDARMARIARDDEAAHDAERRSLAQWRALYELNRRTVDAIADLAAQHAGDAARQQWLQRFERESFAWMFTPALPDRIYSWMLKQSLEQEQIDRAAAIYSDYEAERWPLLREAARIMIRAREEFETVVYSMMDPTDLRGTPRSLYQNLLLNSGRLASVESRAASDLESLLDDNQRRRMRNELRTR